MYTQPEIGIPEKICKNLVVPETVNNLNSAKLLKLVRAGPDAIEGSNYVETYDGRMVSLREKKVRQNIRLRNGDVVHRHIAKGDHVMFNRQPTLRNKSMMSHKAVLVKGNAIHVPLPVTKPYNADFDGDEMNIHNPPDTVARCVCMYTCVNILVSVSTDFVFSTNPLFFFLIFFFGDCSFSFSFFQL